MWFCGSGCVWKRLGVVSLKDSSYFFFPEPLPLFAFQLRSVMSQEKKREVKGTQSDQLDCVSNHLCNHMEFVNLCEHM